MRGMAEQPNISQILAALGELPSHKDIYVAKVLMSLAIAAQRPSGMPLQGQPTQPQPSPHGYPGTFPTTTPSTTTPFNIPQPSNSGSLDLSNIKPVNSGSVSLADAIARARGIAAEKGVLYESGRGNGSRFGLLNLYNCAIFSISIYLC